MTVSTAMTFLILFACLSLPQTNIEGACTLLLNWPASRPIDPADSNRIGEFNNFWIEFRKAVLDGDTTRVMRMTEFPVAVRGDLDFDPVLKISRTDFPRILAAFLSEPSGISSSTTNLDEIRNQRTAAPPGDSDYLVRVGDLEFRRIHGQWKLVLVYVGTSTLQNLGLYPADDILREKP